MNLDIIQNKGLKLTKHKLAILKLFELHKHLDAHKINTLLNEEGNNVSAATIYRVLASFEKNGVVVRHNFNEDQAVYELADPNHHHDHLICTKCNKVIEFYNCQIELLQEEIAKKNSFKIINHHLNLYGICSECKKT
ncbi:MAG: hypothetical protein K0R49_192 [Burkholderiales bacterium]|jgi:Fur family ferric uptake transcriptional regulator|nr:hypothetical protein [Burkholderiales bacterium]MCE3267940.1 hypothetical protein [Burkholderiales bacterium]